MILFLGDSMISKTTLEGEMPMTSSLFVIKLKNYLAHGFNLRFFKLFLTML